MRDPRRFVRVMWIAVHALWSMAALQILALTLHVFGSVSGGRLLSFIVTAFVGALLGAAQQWVLLGSRRAVVKSSAATALGFAVGILAFGATFAACVGVFGEESFLTMLVAVCAGGACLALAQSFVARPMFAQFGLRLATTVAGVAAWLMILLALTRGADTLGLTHEIGARPAEWPISTAIAGLAGAVFGAITSLALSRPNRTTGHSNMARIEGALGQEPLADEA